MVTKRTGCSFPEAFEREISFLGEKVSTFHRRARDKREEGLGNQDLFHWRGGYTQVWCNGDVHQTHCSFSLISGVLRGNIFYTFIAIVFSLLCCPRYIAHVLFIYQMFIMSLTCCILWALFSFQATSKGRSDETYSSRWHQMWTYFLCLPFHPVICFSRYPTIIIFACFNATRPIIFPQWSSPSQRSISSWAPHIDLQSRHMKLVLFVTSCF